MKEKSKFSKEKSMVKKKKGYFSISVASEMFSVHQQTIRMYEKEGLICPKRSEGNTRLFSEEDIDRLEEIIHLTHTLGINLAGVEMILKLKKQMQKMQKEMNILFEKTQENLDLEVENSRNIIEKSSKKLMSLHKPECGEKQEKSFLALALEKYKSKKN